jgi:glycolate oxidase iron-sulfur subunit
LNASERFADTDLCVKCGLCLPHCPTYAKTLDENESPRGRLALIQGYARGFLEPTPELVRHIDRCLLCRSCEAACPAHVPYGSLVDRFREETGSQGKTRSARLKTAALRRLLGPGRLAGLAGRSAPAARRVRALLKPLGLEELAAGLPERSAAVPKPGVYPAVTATPTGEAALFLGCTARLLDAETAGAALKVLTRLGVAVHIPDGQTCCGALHRHAGDADTARDLMKQNLAAFGAPPGRPLLSFASGCAATLRDYREAAPLPEAEALSREVRDISQFLAERLWPADLQPAPLPARVYVHAPCTLRNVLRADRFPLDLLRRIPGLEAVAMPARFRCCGAAGSYLLEHPGMAKALRDDLLDDVLAAGPNFLATSNPGCALHLRAGLKSRGREDIEVVHPVALLARQIPTVAPQR